MLTGREACQMAADGMEEDGAMETVNVGVDGKIPARLVHDVAVVIRNARDRERSDHEAAVAAIMVVNEWHEIRTALEASHVDGGRPTWAVSESPEPSAGLRVVGADGD